MGWLGRIFGWATETSSETEISPEIDVARRRAQLDELESALGELISAMREEPSPVDNPGWQGKIKDYSWVRKEIQILVSTGITHDGVYDLILGVKPVFRGQIPPELSFIGPLQDRVQAAVRQMQAG